MQAGRIIRGVGGRVWVCMRERPGVWGAVVGYLAGLGNVKSRNKEGGQSMFPADKFCLIIRKGE